MNPTPEKQRREEIAARVEAATEGPWRFGQGEWTPVARGVARKAEIPMDPGTVFKTADSEFIAHAREDIPWLLDQLEQSVPRAFSILQQNTIVQLRAELEQAQARERGLQTKLERAVYLAMNLLGMIPREVWRAQGGDDSQGHYEGDYYAENVASELEALAAQSEGSER